jgi:CheY-like chemotaxis protein
MVQRRTQELSTAYQAKSRFLSNMSHEIRTPLNAIIGLSELEYSTAVSTRSKENLGTIKDSGISLLALVNDLLDISDIESGELKLNPEDYSIDQLLEDAAALTRTRIANKPVEFKTERENDLPKKLRGDARQIKQILNRLLDNAVKFTGKGSIILSVRSEKTDDNKVKLIFGIRDTGIGMRDEDLTTIFADYNQIDAGSTRVFGGTGMGLRVSKRLAEMMGGSLTAESEFGKGSVFTAEIYQEAVPVEEKKTTNAENPWLPYAQVLVVDDVPTNLAVARGIMSNYGISVDTANSGREAVDLIAHAAKFYDAIFMDHMMPGMDGIEAVRIIREEINSEYAKTIPVIALTANALPGNEELFLARGFNAFMTKPIGKEVLIGILNTWVRNEEKEKNFAGMGAETKKEKPRPSSESESLHLAGLHVEGVDLDTGIAELGGEESYMTIIKVFISDTPKLLDSIRGFPENAKEDSAESLEKALKTYTITIHGIKGSCFGIFAAGTGELAKELEFAARAGNLKLIAEKNGAFIEAAENLLARLSIILPEKNDQDKIQKPEPDKALLGKLLEAAKNYDIGVMFDILTELETYRYESGGDLVARLRSAADDYEYPEVIKELEHFPNEAIPQES